MTTSILRLHLNGVLCKVYLISDDTPLRPRIKVNSITRSQAKLSIMYDACPENPQDLGVMIQNWKVLVCEKKKVRIPRSDATVNDSFSNYGTHQKCKGRLISFKVSHIKYQEYVCIKCLAKTNIKCFLIFFVTCVRKICNCGIYI